MLNIIAELFVIFFLSLFLLFFLLKVAKHPLIALVDKPNERKFHEGSVPLVGGLSICLSILYFMYHNPDIFSYSHLYAISITVLVTLGVLDDKFDISVRLRMSVQAALAIVMIHLADVRLDGLGEMFGLGNVILPDFFGQIVTILAVIGAINAFNMVDGIDGLLGGLASVTFAAIGVLAFYHGFYNIAYLNAVFVVVMIPYMLFNLGFFGKTRKVFMGDAGSMLIGYTVIWLLVSFSQKPADEQTLRPVAALWFIALPLFDMAAIMIRRIRRGDSPFKPDREHLHHIFQRIGFNSTQTLLTICTIAIIFAAVGILGELANIPEYIMFYSFILCFAIYTALLSHIWKVVSKIRAMKGRGQAN